MTRHIDASRPQIARFGHRRGPAHWALVSGALLWDARLPAGAQASPMTYMHRGRQYVAIAAGGHARPEARLCDHVVVFALPER